MHRGVSHAVLKGARLALPAPPLSSIFPDEYQKALEQIIAARKRAEVTQTELAKMLSRPQSFVSKYESGERRLDVAEFVGIARALGADPIKMMRKIG